MSIAQKPLKILMVIDVFEPVRNGAVTSTSRFANSLRKLGHEVTILSTSELQKNHITTKRLIIPYFDKKYIRPMQMSFAKPSKNLLKKILPKFDCVHIHLPFFLGYTAAKLAQQLKIPCIATHHVQAEWISNGGITWKKAITFCYKLFLKTYNKCQIVICPSLMGQNDIIKYGLTSPSAVISNGVPDHYRQINQSHKNSKDFFTILSVGRLATEKSHDITIRAIQKSKFNHKIKLIIAGTGPERKKLEHLSQILKNKVQFVFVAPEELIHIYNHADLLVHSASTEMEGMAVSEAIACGLVPIIAKHPLSASSQFALDERSLYQFGDADELASKIDFWLSNPNEIFIMRSKYAEFAKQWKLETSLQKLLEVYYSAIKFNQP